MALSANQRREIFIPFHVLALVSKPGRERLSRELTTKLKETNKQYIIPYTPISYNHLIIYSFRKM